ncbi:hypothetical protein EJB05_28508, partial [Eragrostis curvula]
MAVSNCPDVIASMMLHGRVAIVTGGAGGIGSAICKHLASLGASVAVGYIGDPTPARNLVSDINTMYAKDEGETRAIVVEADVSDAAQVKALFDAAASARAVPSILEALCKILIEAFNLKYLVQFGAPQFGGPVPSHRAHMRRDGPASAFGWELHILVAAAAAVLDSSFPSLASTSDATIDATFGTNARGTFLCLREAAGRLVRDGRGRIVTFSASGVASLRPGHAAYTASKAAVEAMTRILARELRGTGITANAVAPGSTGTPMFYDGRTEDEMERYIAEAPLGRLGMPQDIAPLVGFIASDAGHWVNAQVLHCNGGTI